MSRRGALVFFVAASLSASTASCKRSSNKPPSLTRVWLGRSHACAAFAAGGLTCWGENGRRELGDGTSASKVVVDRAPTRRAPADTPREVALGDGHTCALAGSGDVLCWGEGQASEHGAPAAAQVRRASGIAAAGSRTCVVAEGRISCWGGGTPGVRAAFEEEGVASAIGLGRTEMCAAFRSPLHVVCARDGAPAVTLLASVDVVALAVGDRHACARLADGTVRCWGENDRGQLGDGTRRASAEPVVVHGLDAVAELGAGAAHTCARLRNHTVACWGDNARHQLADGTVEPRSRPASVFGLLGVTSLSTAGDATCVTLEGGAVRCWGEDSHGQLATGRPGEVASVPAPLHFAPARAP